MALAVAVALGTWVLTAPATNAQQPRSLELPNRVISHTPPLALTPTEKAIVAEALQKKFIGGVGLAEDAAIKIEHNLPLSKMDLNMINWALMEHGGDAANTCEPKPCKTLIERVREQRAALDQ